MVSSNANRLAAGKYYYNHVRAGCATPGDLFLGKRIVTLAKDRWNLGTPCVTRGLDLPLESENASGLKLY